MVDEHEISVGINISVFTVSREESDELRGGREKARWFVGLQTSKKKKVKK
jgi:hypothetical protein